MYYINWKDVKCWVFHFILLHNNFAENLINKTTEKLFAVTSRPVRCWLCKNENEKDHSVCLKSRKGENQIINERAWQWWSEGSTAEGWRWGWGNNRQRGRGKKERKMPATKQKGEARKLLEKMDKTEKLFRLFKKYNYILCIYKIVLLTTYVFVSVAKFSTLLFMQSF